jgi:hypothetical protein
MPSRTYNGEALSDQFFGSSLAVVASAMSNPFRYFNSSPEIIRLAVLMYVKYPLSLRNVEDLLTERGIDISHETVRLIRMSRPDGGSARCNASRARAQPRSSSQRTPPSTTLSTSNAISRQLNLTA